MISDGINIDTISLLKIKEHLVRLLSFQDVKVLPSAGGAGYNIRFSNLADIPSYAEPCLSDLMLVLDCPQMANIASYAISEQSSEDDTPVSLLVGAIFVDVLLEVLMHSDSLLSMTFITVKNLLKSFTIVLYKHDLDNKLFRHIHASMRSAARRVLDIALSEVSYELRQLSLSIAQVFIKRWPHIVGNLPLYEIFCFADIS